MMVMLMIDGVQPAYVENDLYFSGVPFNAGAETFDIKFVLIHTIKPKVPFTINR
jgi:hypothetical protein